MPVRGLTILVATGDADRFHAALSFAAAGAATGMAVHLHLHEGAVALLRPPIAAPADVARGTAGLPTLAQLLDESLDLGVAITACQSGLALASLALDDLDSRIEAQGPVGLLAALRDDRVLTF
jgi:predicted peroxiredoxin